MNVSSIIDQVTRHVYGAIAQLSAAVSPSGSFPSHLYSERRTMSELGYLFAEEVRMIIVAHHVGARLFIRRGGDVRPSEPM